MVFPGLWLPAVTSVSSSAKHDADGQLVVDCFITAATCIYDAMLLQAKSAAETARQEAESNLTALRTDYEKLQAEVKRAQDVAEQLAAAAAASSGTAQQQQGKKAKRKAKKAKGFGKLEPGDESGG